jgi:AcrR family transcriptional regulator
MGAQTQGERKAETRSRLIAAAADLFARKGFHAVSAEAVADAADRTTGALYSHFGSKDGLLLALVEQWLEESAARIEAIVEVAPDLDGRLLALWRGWSAPHEEHGDAWMLLEFELWLHAARDADFAHRLAERYAVYRRQMATPLAAWVRDDGLGRLTDAQRTAADVIALLLGLVMQQRVDPTALTDDDIVASLRASITGGTSR